MSELTNKRLEEIASGQNTVSIPEAVELARELREAREEIEMLRLERDGAVACMDSRLKQIETLTAERDEARRIKNDILEFSGREILKLRDGVGKEIESLQSELAALKSAPSMAEVDAAKRDCIDLLAKIVLARGIEEESKPPQPNPVPSYQELRERIDKLADLARRSISSREEVVGMLDQMESDIRDVFSDDWCLLDELKNLSRCDTLQPYAAAHRLLAIACCPEIVEGK